MGDEDDGDGGGASGGDQREPTAAAATSSLAAMPAKRRQQRHNHEREEQETAPHHEPEEQDQPQEQQEQQQRVDQRAVRPFYFSSRMHVTPPHCPSDTHARTCPFAARMHVTPHCPFNTHWPTATAAPFLLSTRLGEQHAMLHTHTERGPDAHLCFHGVPSTIASPVVKLLCSRTALVATT